MKIRTFSKAFAKNIVYNQKAQFFIREMLYENFREIETDIVFRR